MIIYCPHKSCPLGVPDKKNLIGVPGQRQGRTKLEIYPRPPANKWRDRTTRANWGLCWYKTMGVMEGPSTLAPGAHWEDSWWTLWWGIQNLNAINQAGTMAKLTAACVHQYPSWEHNNNNMGVGKCASPWFPTTFNLPFPCWASNYRQTCSYFKCFLKKLIYKLSVRFSLFAYCF